MEDGLWELVAAGLVTADGFENLRALIDPKRRKGEGRGRDARSRHAAGRWALLHRSSERRMPTVMERIAAVKELRHESKSKPTQELARSPTRFHVTVIPKADFLVIPKVSSERRHYVPIAWLSPPTIPSDLVFVLQGADLWHFGILTSWMHMAWLRQIGGRLKSDYRYSAGIVYNTFPWPDADDRQRKKVRVCAQAVLAARAEFPDATLADLYDADVMPQQLRKAHRELDEVVDKLYRAVAFTGDRDRAEHLFGAYERLVAPLVAASQRRGRGAKTRPAEVGHVSYQP